MFFPDLCAWVEEENFGFRQWIDVRYLLRLGEIARGVRQRPIEERIGAATCRWNDVVQVEAITARTLRRMAVLTAMLRALLDPVPERDRR